jgi:hypothetical protein
LESNIEVVPELAVQVHSFWLSMGMVMVADPALLVAVALMDGGVPEVSGVLLSVPQSWATPVVKFTFWIPKLATPDGADPAVNPVRGNEAELLTATVSQKGTPLMALK